MPGALDGVRVLDLGQYVAGPLAAMLLADQGADVVRVDPPPPPPRGGGGRAGRPRRTRPGTAASGASPSTSARTPIARRRAG